MVKCTTNFILAIFYYKIYLMYSKAVNTVLLIESICTQSLVPELCSGSKVNPGIPNILSAVNETKPFLCTMWLVASFVGLLLDKRVVPC